MKNFKKIVLKRLVVMLLVFFAILPASFAAEYTNSDIASSLTPPKGKITDEYVQKVAQASYMWGWPMVNIHNRRETFKDLKGPGLMGGIVPVAPANQLSMLSDYIDAGERLVACPNQDVVYGFGLFSLEQDAVVVQVPDFKGRFWVYQMGNQRTDEISSVGAMYQSKPGFYLIVGPNWKGKVPAGITEVIHSDTNLGTIIPRIFVSDEPSDKRAVQPIINQIMMYPLSQYDGKMKTKDWKNDNPTIPSVTSDNGNEETKWVIPEKFYDELPLIMKEVPPMPGEEPLYAAINAVLEAGKKDPRIKEVFTKAVVDADKNLLAPLFQFHNYGIKLPNNWTTITNGAEFKNDYITRVAVAKSNIFVNKGVETRYFYQDFDSNRVRLNAAKKYTITFPKGKIPPVNGFWSLTMYNQYHFFEKNNINRYSLGTKNKDLKYNKDGSLTLYIQADQPSKDKMSNWLPAPKTGDFSVYLRAYWPKAEIADGSWLPPAVIEVK
jgi:hypothetical protein